MEFEVRFSPHAAGHGVTPEQVHWTLAAPDSSDPDRKGRVRIWRRLRPDARLGVYVVYADDFATGIRWIVTALVRREPR